MPEGDRLSQRVWMHAVTFSRLQEAPRIEEDDVEYYSHLLSAFVIGNDMPIEEAIDIAQSIDPFTSIYTTLDRNRYYGRMYDPKSVDSYSFFGRVYSDFLQVLNSLTESESPFAYGLLRTMAEFPLREKIILEDESSIYGRLTISREMQLGHMQAAAQSFPRAIPMYSPLRQRKEAGFVGSNPIWYGGLAEIFGKNEKNGNDTINSHKAIWNISYHSIEKEFYKLYANDIIADCNNRLGLDQVLEIVDMGTGDDPSKLYPIIDALLARWDYSNTGLKVYLVDAIEDSAKKSEELLKEKYKEANIEFVVLPHTFETLHEQGWKQLNQYSKPTQRLVTFMGNTAWNVQDNILHYLGLMPDGIALLTSHLIPAEVYDLFRYQPDIIQQTLKDLERNPTINIDDINLRLAVQIALSYSSEYVQDMGRPFAKSCFTQGSNMHLVKNICDPADTMNFYISNLDNDYILSAIPGLNIDPYNPPPEMGEPLLIPKVDNTNPFTIRILNSLKWQKHQLMNHFNKLGCYDGKNLLFYESDPYISDSVQYPAGLVGIAAFNIKDIKEDIYRIAPPRVDKFINW